jgi:hypothetical protein
MTERAEAVRSAQALPRDLERPMLGDLVHIDVKKLERIEREGHRIHGDPPLAR